MPEWFETSVVIVFAIAAVFFFAKYRETAAALHESERMKKRLSNDLDRYRDMPRLRALRDALISAGTLPVDDEGREHLLLRDADRQLHHVTLHRQCTAVGEGETVTYRKDGEEVALQELA
ncbi:hypothetical protein [Microbulbifer thermotolerans]|uniref:Uncharacterized protein n=1 Tax=Microbulbifer thermotolerans TaxID=252514 RepID=A0A143HQ78_MICTH|nr:hypothetical protein [Microbulbifer thermotolerans]AMX03884.1 hypothetical protein A3224_15975 [Microbulbifer thermotolerans]MCX2778598.1 hypothetical protein [Microbulbifer thermotolerans]MCX2782856.1 hypothetical protein [Microbulbifer thermotolerans]MCX2794074.1 hypothetical protein [Microbulbifer thermotolerans]MCX2802969.1 hypothetical protein [Microbulbifer thermotolerans]